MPMACHVDEDGGEVASDPHVPDRARHRVPMPVHVVDVGAAAADHLEECQARAVIDILLGELPLRRPDPVLEPLHEGDIVAVAAEERHCGVGVSVLQRRKRVEARRLNRPVGLPFFAERGDLPFLDEDLAGSSNVSSTADDKAEEE